MRRSNLFSTGIKSADYSGFRLSVVKPKLNQLLADAYHLHYSANLKLVVKPKQNQSNCLITFDTQLKIALYAYKLEIALWYSLAFQITKTEGHWDVEFIADLLEL